MLERRLAIMCFHRAKLAAHSARSLELNLRQSTVGTELQLLLHLPMFYIEVDGLYALTGVGHPVSESGGGRHWDWLQDIWDTGPEAGSARN